MKRALAAAVLGVAGAAALGWLAAWPGGTTSALAPEPDVAVARDTPAPEPPAEPAEPSAVPPPPEVELPVPSIPTPWTAPPSATASDALQLEARARAIRSERLPAPFELLRAHAEPKRAPGAADWLAQHAERGQSFSAFRASQPELPGRTIYLTTTGALDPAQRALTRELAPLLAAFFQLDVKWLPALADEVASVKSRDGLLGPQLYTHTILDALGLRRPADAVALMAIAGVDLYPDPSWNFVYGQAHYGKRVGVMSFARDGDPATERAQILRRSFSTASHEIGHMFGIRHCIAWECGMNGRNHRSEADAAPLEPCPACLAKLHVAIGFDPERRWRELVKHYARSGLGADALAVTVSQRAIRSEAERDSALAHGPHEHVD